MNSSSSGSSVVWSAAHQGDYKTISQLPPEELKKVSVQNRTILHVAAINHNLDFLFACICLGIDQTIVDTFGKTFVDYLAIWEYFHIKQLKIIWKMEKIQINVYFAAESLPAPEYVPHGFLVNAAGIARPMICGVWEQDRGISELEQILEAGIDLDNPELCKAVIPEKYACLLAEYGWISVAPTSPPRVIEHSRKFYRPDLWKNDAVIKTIFKTITVAKIPATLLGATIVCISDVHWQQNRLHIPGGDCLICAGDSAIPKVSDLTEFIVWFASHAHKYKIMIAGNHDRLIQSNKDYYLPLFKKHGITYLEDSGTTVCGLKIWGSPWTAKRPKNKNNAFTLSKRELMKKWDLVPADTDVLITHSPPFRVGDMNSDYYKGVFYQSGDPGLRKTINRLERLRVHIFGHQHLGKGIYEGIFPGKRMVYFVNCALPQDPFPTVL